MAVGMNVGKLIVFEGTDGTGKSTQLQLLATYLREGGCSVVETKEPTNGQYGTKIRALYTKRSACSREEELELFLADRKEHVDSLITPSLQAGQIVLCDRYFLSTAAYQGAVGFDVEEILSRNSFAPDPDLALLFLAPLETGQQRIVQGRGDSINDFEKKDYLEKVARIFTAIKRPYIKKIDASGTIEEVQEQVNAAVNQLVSLNTGE